MLLPGGEVTGERRWASGSPAEGVEGEIYKESSETRRLECTGRRSWERLVPPLPKTSYSARCRPLPVPEFVYNLPLPPTPRPSTPAV
ncbi:hypothetical protein E2C01_097357 [Portunus trituberculatus]|uniref:Uncharacterized protein n=1 Tax=Portunus trituberculatus TaxID=210409 RepID=A0A5B7JUZ3_PORTR|nr:hypothetical protein [Portunus trituberculatus]